MGKRCSAMLKLYRVKVRVHFANKFLRSISSSFVLEWVRLPSFPSALLLPRLPVSPPPFSTPHTHADMTSRHDPSVSDILLPVVCYCLIVKFTGEKKCLILIKKRLKLSSCCKSFPALHFCVDNDGEGVRVLIHPLICFGEQFTHNAF